MNMLMSVDERRLNAHPLLKHVKLAPNFGSNGIRVEEPGVCKRQQARKRAANPGGKRKFREIQMQTNICLSRICFSQFCSAACEGWCPHHHANGLYAIHICQMHDGPVDRRAKPKVIGTDANANRQTGIIGIRHRQMISR